MPSFETLVFTCKSKRFHNSEDHDMNIPVVEKPQIDFFILLKLTEEIPFMELVAHRAIFD